VAILLDADFIGNLKNDMKWVDGPATNLMHMLEEKDVKRTGEEIPPGTELCAAPWD
jgi:hypothetical protein